MADIIVCPSNTPHFFTKEIEEASGSVMISIIDVTVKELRRRGAQRIGFTGLGITKVWAERLVAEGFELLTATPEQIAELDEAILSLMEGNTTLQHRAAGWAAINSVRSQSADVTIMGCTEISLVLGPAARDAEDLIDPGLLLAEAAIRKAASLEDTEESPQ